ncbi:MAG: DUF4340 domain-containing protein [Bacteroidia bacterium]|nr:DUF4340 domain-containing protein [Bacteroidia bacterium]
MKTKTLLIIFVILLVFVIGSFFLKKGESSFRNELVTLDSARVSSIVFTPKVTGKKEITLSGEGNNWKMLYDGKTTDADVKLIQQIISEIKHIRAERVAATGEDKWKAFDITDSAGIHVKVMQGNKTAADFVVGKFSYNQASRTPYSYLRIKGDKEVFSIAGYISMLFNRQPNLYRNKVIVDSKRNTWTKLAFHYPADSSFVMSKQGTQWMVDGIATDSNKITGFLNSLAQLRSTSFVDDVKKPLSPAEFSLQIEDDKSGLITISASPADSINKQIITTSMNKDAFFSGAKENLFSKIFVPKSRFISQ